MNMRDEPIVALAFPGPAMAPFRGIDSDALGQPAVPAEVDADADFVTVSGLERWDQEQTRSALLHIRRVLRPGGVLRVSTTDLDAAVQGYAFCTAGPTSGVSRAQRLNDWFRRPGQAWVYNEEDLTTMLQGLGFADIRRFVPGAGSHPVFWGLDVDAVGLLVLEARRTKAA